MTNMKRLNTKEGKEYIIKNDDMRILLKEKFNIDLPKKALIKIKEYLDGFVNITYRPVNIEKKGKVFKETIKQEETIEYYIPTKDFYKATNIPKEKDILFSRLWLKKGNNLIDATQVTPVLMNDLYLKIRIIPIDKDVEKYCITKIEGLKE